MSTISPLSTPIFQHRSPFSPSTPSNSNIPKPSKKVLLVEDDLISGKLEKRVIESAGYECDVVNTLSKAHSKLNEEHCAYDVVVSDHNINTGEADCEEEENFTKELSKQLFPKGLPKGAAEGIILLEFIKQHFTHQRPSVVLISAVDGVAEKQLEHYANERNASFIKKPLNGTMLRNVLENPFAASAVFSGPEPA